MGLRDQKLKVWEPLV